MSHDLTALNERLSHTFVWLLFTGLNHFNDFFLSLATAVQPFFFTTVIVFAPAVAFTASVLATYTAFIFGANATRKSAKCDSVHYCAASHSAVNCLIVC